MGVTDLKQMKLCITAKEAAILEHKNPETIRTAIQNGTYPFGKVYTGKKHNIYAVSTIPLLNFLGITEDVALKRLGGKQ